MKNLLIKLREHIETENGFFGMCGSIQEMREYAKSIGYGEADILKEYIDDNRGKNRYKPSPLYWWKPGNKQPRINWLNRQIIKLSLDF